MKRVKMWSLVLSCVGLAGFFAAQAWAATCGLAPRPFPASGKFDTVKTSCSRENFSISEATFTATNAGLFKSLTVQLFGPSNVSATIQGRNGGTIVCEATATTANNPDGVSVSCPGLTDWLGTFTYVQ